MPPTLVDLELVTSETQRTELRRLLVAFHRWMTETGPDSYDPEEELAEDLETLEHKSECWAWLARADGRGVGCILLYGETAELAEFRRLWVEPPSRGRGIGRALTERVVEAARDRGFRTLGLTTPPWAETAQRLYEEMGFEHTEPYPETRLPEKFHADAIFMQLPLRDDEPTGPANPS